MNTAPYPRVSHFLFDLRETGPLARHAECWIDIAGGDFVAPGKFPEHRDGRAHGNAMRAPVFRMRLRDNQRLPRRVGLYAVVVRHAGTTDRRPRSPCVERVLRLEYGDQRV